MHMVDEISSRYYWLFFVSLFLGIFVGGVVAHLNSVHGPNRTTRKTIDLAIVAISLFSILQISAELRSDISSNVMKTFPSQAPYVDMLPFSDPSDSSYCHKFHKSADSPPDFNLVERKHEAFCDWLKAFHRMNTTTPQNWKNVVFPVMPNGFPSNADALSKAFPPAWTKSILDEIKIYEEDKSDHDRLAATAHDEDGPYRALIGGCLLSLAGGLAIARILWAKRLMYT